MVGSRLFLNVREKLLHPNPTIEQSMSSFEMRPYTLTDPDGIGIGPPSPLASNSEPNSATTLIAKHTPWAEKRVIEENVKVVV